MNRATKLHVFPYQLKKLMGLPDGVEIDDAQIDDGLWLTLSGGKFEVPAEVLKCQEPLLVNADHIDKNGRLIGRLHIWTASKPPDRLQVAEANARLSQDEFLQKKERDGLPISALVAFGGDAVPMDALGTLMSKAMAIKPSKDEVVDWVFLPSKDNCPAGRKGYVGFTWSQRFKDE